ILERIEHEVETLVEYQQHGAPPHPAPTNGAEAAPAPTAVAVAQTTSEPGSSSAAPYYRPPPVHDGADTPPPAEHKPLRAEDLPEAELLGRIDRLDAMTGHSRDVL